MYTANLQCPNEPPRHIVVRLAEGGVGLTLCIDRIDS
eukprot:gene9829-109_t